MTYTILIGICIVGFWVFENFYTPAVYSDGTQTAPSFETTWLPTSTTGEVVYHQHYALSYNEPFEQAEWVAYTLKPAHLTHDDRKRPYFIEDPKVGSKSADWKNYKRSGFDRGHLCPAGDRRFSLQAYNETFYTSNISPQRKDFNAGVWNRLEMKTRQWCKKYGTLKIITAGVLQNGLQEIGGEGVDVPNHFYKIIYRNGSNEGIAAFLMPHRESKRPLQSFLVPVDSIEQLTGIDFFPEKTRGWQEKMESSVVPTAWRF